MTTLAGQDLTQQIAQNLEAVRSRIAKSADSAGRNAADVRLIAVSKAQPDERVAAALAAGWRCYGENRVQEARQRWEQRRTEHDDLKLHLIGPLQTNKVNLAVQLFDVIHTVDRPKLAAALAKTFTKTGRELPCYIEINVGEEEQKAGVLPGAADDFIRACRETYALPIVGLMCIPPFDAPPAPFFALLRTIAERNGVDRLSMGMSADFEVAVELGATDVRVGTAIFGERTPRPQHS